MYLRELDLSGVLAGSENVSELNNLLRVIDMTDWGSSPSGSEVSWRLCAWYNFCLIYY